MKESQSVKNKDFKRAMAYVKPYKSNIVISFICNVGYAFFSLFTLGMIVPFVLLLFGLVEPVTVLPPFDFSIDTVKNMLSYYITYFNDQYGVFQALMFVSAVFILCSLLSNLFRFLGMYYLTAVNAKATEDLRNHLYEKILILPVSFYTTTRSGDIITRFNADMHEVDTALIRHSIDLLLRQPLLIIVFIGTLLVLNPWLTLISFLVFPLISYVMGKISKAIRRKAQQGQAELSLVSSMYEETVSGLGIIKAFSSQEYFSQKFQQTNSWYSKYAKKMIRYLELSAPVSEILTIVSLLAIVFIGGMMLIGNPTMDASNLILFVLVFARLIPPVQTIIKGYGYVQKGLVSARRIFDILDSDEKIVERPNAIPVKKLNNYIELKNVDFAYDNEQILSNINLKIKKGETVAIVGQSGGGKSTIVNLLLRFYDVNKGEINIDGHNIQDYVISDVRTLFGIVIQDVMLFNDTIYNNICFGVKEVAPQQVTEAAKHANAHDFIMDMPEGYDTVIGDRGMKLSGGQRQRISIARAILQDPPVLLFDEATSSLDSQSEQIVQEAITRLMQNRTSIVIAHRLSTIQNADRIIVLKDGKIVEEGFHKDLMNLKGEYYKLVSLQQL
ncbi:MAG: ABC transporter ATP-binding protein/permease [Bacteroidales bacterium]|jgi:subfamily B ATP-binding cassette protein MsbA|nr:ABC transporter ATP-binding protein/permease [Bacteroidales bacterium]